jgi:hypothetical protein
MKNGGIIGTKNNSSVYAAKGLWSLKEQYENNRNNAWQKQIVTNGLVTWLDAANPASYSGSGNTWTDLSGNNQNFTIYGSTYFNPNGYFTFRNDQITDYIMRENYGIPTTQTTISVWFRSSFLSNQQTPITYSVSGNNELLFLIDNPAQVAPHPKGVRWQTSTSSMFNKWVNLTWTRNTSNGQNIVYRDGEFLASYTESINNPLITGGSMIIGQEADAPSGGFDPIQNLDGDFSHLLVYNRVLSEAEIKNNFYALADRYEVRATPQFSASGGTMSYIGDYIVHAFTSSENFIVTSSNVLDPTVEYLVVGGGGSGGSDMGGGGGAGGYLAGNTKVTVGSYIATVGSGGFGDNSGIGSRRGFEGQNSSLVGSGVNLVALGGGGGASNHDRGNNPAGGLNNGQTVGSGGGASGGGGGAQDNRNPDGTYGGSRRGTGTVGQGHDGGTGGGFWYPAGGGGSAGPGTSIPPAGGPGTANNILGTTFHWAAGGGGSNYSEFQANTGGIGGGGGGAANNFNNAGVGGLNPATAGGGGNINSQTNVPGGNAGANTGSGGGGGSHYSSNNFGGNGGSGIVIVRYKV